MPDGSPVSVRITPGAAAAGRAAAADVAALLQAALRARGAANVVLATGLSQSVLLAELVREAGIDWSRVTAFHLDEYVGLPARHPASFRRFLRERFVGLLPTRLASFHEIDGEAPPQAECARLGRLIESVEVDLALVGIGENGHLAFNDPPADFDTRSPYLVVALDEACRRQQVGEGWFASLDAVPRSAISMSIRQILASRTIVCTAPERRKADAVRATLLGPITPAVPASALRRHPDVRIHLDEDSAARLEEVGP